jgi:glycerophosphoryl diester phosphodiesterase
MPAIIAHRGACLVAPENTIRAFERAIGIGVDRIELDLRRTRDGGIVVIHDADLQRLCGTEGRVAELSLTEVRSLPVLASEYGQAIDTAVPDFDRIAPRCPLYLELKTDGDTDPEEFADRVLDLVPNGTVHRIASFDSRVVEYALKHGHRAVLIADEVEALESIDAGLRPKLQALSLRCDRVEARTTELVRELGIELWIWTVDEPAVFERLEEIGALDAWCTNDPRGLRGWLRGRGL